MGFGFNNPFLRPDISADEVLRRRLETARLENLPNGMMVGGNPFQLGLGEPASPSFSASPSPQPGARPTESTPSFPSLDDAVIPAGIALAMINPMIGAPILAAKTMMDGASRERQAQSDRSKVIGGPDPLSVGPDGTPITWNSGRERTGFERRLYEDSNTGQSSLGPAEYNPRTALRGQQESRGEFARAFPETAVELQARKLFADPQYVNMAGKQENGMLGGEPMPRQIRTVALGSPEFEQMRAEGWSITGNALPSNEGPAPPEMVNLLNLKTNRVQAVNKFAAARLIEENPEIYALAGQVDANAQSEGSGMINLLDYRTGRVTAVNKAAAERLAREQPDSYALASQVSANEGARRYENMMLPGSGLPPRLVEVGSPDYDASAAQGWVTAGPVSLTPRQTMKIAYTPDGRQELVDASDPETAAAIQRGEIKLTPPKNLSDGARTSLKALGDVATEYAALESTFNNDFVGNPIGGIENALGRAAPSMATKGQPEWWQRYQSQVNRVRKDLFGAALTPTEQAEFEKSIITPTTGPSIARENLRLQNEIIQRGVSRLRQSYASGGYNMGEIDPLLGMTDFNLSNGGSGGMPPQRGGMPAAPNVQGSPGYNDAGYSPTLPDPLGIR